MLLINIMYHHADSDRYSNTTAMLDAHFAYIAAHYPTVLPAEKTEGTCVCLTFDDGYCDFYFNVFPLLKKYNLKALLAFSSKYLIDASNLDPAKRLSYKHAQAHENYLQGTFCTLAELKEMVDSGHVMVASHGHTHTNLLSKEVDLDVEIRQSRHLLEKALGVDIACFVFPFGKYDERILCESQRHYRYVFRIGNAIHKDFSGIKGVNYRVNGDGLKHPKEIFSPLNLARFWLKGLLKRLIA